MEWLEAVHTCGRDARILKASGILIAQDPLLDTKSAEVAAMAIDPYLRERAFLPEATAANGRSFAAVCLSSKTSIRDASASLAHTRYR
jgi:hypothetical protein